MSKKRYDHSKQKQIKIIEPICPICKQIGEIRGEIQQIPENQHTMMCHCENAFCQVTYFQFEYNYRDSNHERGTIKESFWDYYEKLGYIIQREEWMS